MLFSPSSRHFRRACLVSMAMTVPVQPSIALAQGRTQILVLNGLESLTNSSIQASEIEGAGQIVLNGASSDLIFDPAGSLTIDSGVLIRTGTVGAIILAGFENQNVRSGASIINNGTISAETPGQTITFQSESNVYYTTLINNGLISDKNGASINFDCAVINNGTLSFSDCTVNLPASLTPNGEDFSYGFENHGTILASNCTFNIAPFPVYTMQPEAPVGVVIGGTIVATNSTLDISVPIQLSQIPQFESNQFVLRRNSNLDLQGASITLDSNTLLAFFGGAVSNGTVNAAGRIIPVTGQAIFLNANVQNATVDLESGQLFANLNNCTVILNGTSDSANEVIVSLDASSTIVTGTAGGTVEADNGSIKAINGHTINLITDTNSGLIYAGPGSTVGIGPMLENPQSEFQDSGTLTADGGTISVFIGIPFRPFVQSLSGTLQAINGGAFNFVGSSLILSAPLLLNNGNVLFNETAQFATTITGPGTVTVAATQSLLADSLNTTSLILNGSLILRPGGADATVLQALFLATAADGTFTSQIDLADNKFILQSGGDSDKHDKIAFLTAALASGSAGASWTGQGVTSSTAAVDPAHYAVGLFDNAFLQLTTFGNQPVDANSVLLTIAHIGDANDDGVVDIRDLAIITNHWQTHQNNWAAGDLNGDGIVDLQDLTLVTNNWQETTQLPSTSSAAPEPATAALLAMPVLLALKRQRPKACGSFFVPRVLRENPPIKNPKSKFNNPFAPSRTPLPH